MLPAAFINPGDVTLMTVPGYPVAGTHTKYYGGEVHRLPLLAAERFLARPGFDSGRRASPGQAAGAQLSQQPDGQVATRDFYRRVIDFAQRASLVVVQDAAHIMLTYDGAPLSFLSVPGAKEVGVEVHSMSKGFHMIGWRLGWVCGHERIVQAFADVKDNSDSGQFIAIQKAAAAALDDAAIPRQVREKYDAACRSWSTSLTRCGFDCHMPGGTYFLYTPSPKGLAGGPRFDTAEAASQYLITEHSICTVPWDDAGAFLRFSVTYEAPDEAAEDALMAETEARLKRLRLEF